MDNLISKFDITGAVNDLLATKKFNQTSLAEAIGVTQGRISQIANGTSAAAKYETRFILYRLCQENGIVTTPITDNGSAAVN